MTEPPKSLFGAPSTGGFGAPSKSGGVGLFGAQQPTVSTGGLFGDKKPAPSPEKKEAPSLFGGVKSGIFGN